MRLVEQAAQVPWFHLWRCLMEGIGWMSSIVTALVTVYAFYDVYFCGRREPHSEPENHTDLPWRTHGRGEPPKERR